MHDTHTRTPLLPLVFLSAIFAAAGTREMVVPENYCWSGFNPFFQPSHTLNYYGSGDVDNNCVINRNDLDSLEALSIRKATVNIRADIDGSGTITGNDVALLQNHLASGTALPGHWNELTEEQRMAWLKQCLTLDLTSSIPGGSGNFVCGHFSCQFYLNFSYFGGNYSHTTFRGGGTIFNIPAYTVTLSGHMINAVLIGDDPLAFADWRFIEPQNFSFVDPVAQGEGFTLSNVTYPMQNSIYGNTILSAIRTVDGWSIEKRAKGLVTQRPQVPQRSGYVDMIPSWNPRVIRSGDPLVLFERLDDRLPPTTSIYLGRVCGDTVADVAPLITDTMSSRLLDVVRTPTGGLRVLWRGTNNFRPALFTAIVDPQNRSVTGRSMPAESRLAYAGSLCAISEDSLHIFWLLDGDGDADSAPCNGINRSVVAATVWSPPDTVERFLGTYIVGSWSQRLLLNYTVTSFMMNGKPAALCIPQPAQVSTRSLHLKLFSQDGVEDYPAFDDTLVTGGRGVAGNDNRIHCIYWSCSGGRYWLERGAVRYRFFDKNCWSAPEVLDSAENNRCGDIAVNDRGDLLCVWEKEPEAGRSVWCTRVRSNGVWQTTQIESAPDNEEVWYPRITALEDTSYIVAWESRGTYRTRLRFRQLTYSPGVSVISRGRASVAGNGCRVYLQGERLIVRAAAGVAAVAGSITLFDLQGRVVFSTTCVDICNSTIDLQGVGRGFGIVRVETSTGFRYTVQVPRCK